MFIKGSTKRGQNLIDGADYYKGYYLDEVYGSYSSNKARAWRYNHNLMQEMNGRNFRITSSCSHFFSVAWECEVEYEDPKTGEVTMEPITYIATGRNVYEVLLDK